VAAGKIKELPKEQHSFEHGGGLSGGEQAAVHPVSFVSLPNSHLKDELTMREAGDYLGISPPTLRQMIRKGVLSAYPSEVDRRTKVILRSALEALKQRRTQVLVLLSFASILFPTIGAKPLV
jgi:excisionase family DNA binding protein